VLDEYKIKRPVMGGELRADAAMDNKHDRVLPPVLNLLTQPYYAPAENPVLLGAAKLKIFRCGKKVATGDGTLGWSLQTEMTFLHIGGLEVLLLPCELFPELAYGGYLAAEESATGKSPSSNPTPLCKIAENPDLLIFNLVNDMTGYVVPPNDWALHPTQPYLDGAKDRLGRKHYEETNSLGPKTAHVTANVFRALVEQVRRAQNG
ncbi:MAG: hypothetical protein LBB50_02770, partial [Oscillospiraceae bacterium]|jgi:hypothetical protein|nr:hypothetical protein [Oscillospiraceae bacterium]